jgi:hypothetical protein
MTDTRDTAAPQPELGPDGKEWAKTQAGYDHVDAMMDRADGTSLGPYWYGWALREAFVAGAEWQEKRAALSTAPPPTQPEGHEAKPFQFCDCQQCEDAAMSGEAWMLEAVRLANNLAGAAFAHGIACRSREDDPYNDAMDDEVARKASAREIADVALLAHLRTKGE